MLFHSQVFLLVFLPLVVGGFYALAERVHLREWFLVLASLLFYGWWDVRFLPLILAQVLGSWLLAQLALRQEVRWPCWLAVALNLCVLGAYKYLEFFTVSLESALGVTLPRAGLILPIGISFYTFQIVSYLVDVTRGSAPRMASSISPLCDLVSAARCRADCPAQ